MNTKHHLGLATALALATTALSFAQDTTAPGTPPGPPPPPPAQTTTTTTTTGYNGAAYVEPAAGAQIDISAPYAFRFHNAGVVADAGGIWEGNFIGGEISYYDARPHGYAWYNPSGIYSGWVHYHDSLTSVNLAYRYQFPLWKPYASDRGAPGLDAYVGASAGVAWLRFDDDNGYNYSGFYGGPGYSNQNKGRFDANGVAGVEWKFTRAVGVKVGYRFIWVDRAHIFYDNQRIDSGAVEAGLAFRF